MLRVLLRSSFHEYPCKLVCGTVLSGAMSVVFRTVGIKRSSRNPNICTRCSTHIEEGRLAEITVLFADLSSFTELTHDLGAERTHEVVDAFLGLANLYTLWHARKLRLESKVGTHLAAMTTLEKRQTIFVLTASLTTLAIVIFEIIAHAIMH